MTVHINPKLVDAALTVVEHLTKEIQGLKGIVISTEDGFDIASSLPTGVPAARLSAMVSSLAALGAVAGEENNLGTCDNNAITFSGGHLVMVQARHTEAIMIVSMVLSKDALVGQALYFAANAVKHLEAA